jgi:uncharacterized circularly permuted ATP-grasp superfamily protein/uncharacterized alpha-E superfamily protein
MSDETGKKADAHLDSTAPMNEASVEPEQIPAPPPVKSQRAAQLFDESVSADGKLRPYYAKFFNSLEQIGAGELERRWENARRLVQEQGITYNVYGDARGMERTWELDPVPFLISADEWRTLEAGLVQRAELINRILADCYGPQNLIRTGGLPPALVFGQPDFLRPCHGIQPKQGKFLIFYAADVARSPDGRWWVISDRTQIPTGTGYALANRLVMSRTLPEAFRDCQVHRLAGFYREMQKTLAQLAPLNPENPRIVMLTPGPYNETYFEQAYLARYLGYQLVEGQDLTVRDDRVFLKTLAGLEVVDVILRRVDDEFCDPLELRNDSILGVPGLVEAARAGTVTMANLPGSSLLQSPAFMAFLPGLCRHVLGEKLKLPSVATWWCGQKPAEKYVLEHLDELFVKPAFRPRQSGVLSERELSRAAHAALVERIKFQPHGFVAQEWVELSTAPALDGGKLVPRPVSLRVFLVATENGYAVMPGGLSRVAPHAGASFVSMQHGGMSKDTWVLSDEPVPEVSLLSTSGPNIELRRVGNNLPSRLADNFFWLGRYAERADATTRLLRSALRRFTPERGGGALPHLAPLLETLTKQGQLTGHQSQKQSGQGQSRSLSRNNSEALEAGLLAAIFDPQRDGSVRQLVGHLQRIAMFVRDRTSNDLWRAANQLGDLLATPPEGKILLAADALGILNQTLLGLACFHGLARENMTRAQGWRFIDIGMRIERAMSLCTFLDRALRSPEADNPSLLETVLEVADSTLTYRSRYNLLPNIAAVYDLVLLDDTNPRSLFFQINQLAQHLERLPREMESVTPQQKLLRDCSSRLRTLDTRELARRVGDWPEGETGQLIVETLRDLPRLSDAIAVSYFAHSEISRTGGGVQP